MQRRHFLAQSSLFAAAAAFAPSPAFAMSPMAPDALRTASLRCLSTGEDCLQHCMESLSSGSKSMAACAVTVREMLVYCEALTKAWAQKSKHLPALAKIAAAACRDCESECRKHTNMAVCSNCAEACAQCARLCDLA